MGKLFKWFGLAVVTLAIAAVMIVLVAGLRYRSSGPELTASGLPHDASQYLTMRDGTRIAIEIWLPSSLKSGERVPALIEGTPYWRAADLTFLGGALAELGLPILDGDPSIKILNQRGFAVIAVDTRGTGASFGHQNVVFDDTEVGDFGEIVDWTSRQGWSNGRVGAYGFSYRGVLAVDMASLGRPALKAIAPSFDVPDLYLTTHPGGVFNETFLRKWGSQTGELNRGNLPCTGICRWLISGPKHVDGDDNRTLLKAAIADHARNFDVFACAKSAPERDSKVCTSGKTLTDTSELARKAAIEQTGVPIYVVAGYFDGPLPAQLLWRFQAFSNPQQVLLGPISHGGFQSTDPFAAKSAGVDPHYADQVLDMADFFDRYLKPGGSPITRTIIYKVMNGGGWQRSSEWPPRGVVTKHCYLVSDHQLTWTKPSVDGSDIYKVDFSASTGDMSRYQSPVDLSKTSYPDRAQEDRKLLTYTSAPLESDMEIAGDPVTHLDLATSSVDGEVIIYLEDVRPDGTVVYLTEGVLRLLDRKPSRSGLAEVSADPLHTYLKRDESPMIPGAAETIEIGLSPIAARFLKGERIRIAVAGADVANLERIPSDGTETFTLSHGPNSPSFVELPVAYPK